MLTGAVICSLLLGPATKAGRLALAMKAALVSNVLSLFASSHDAERRLLS